MKFRDAVKYLRSELGLTQVELAKGLNINAITVGRWENGKTVPTRSFTALLLEYARSKGASKECLDILTQSINAAAKGKLKSIGNGESVEQLRAIIANINGGVSVVIYEDNGMVRLAYANDHYYALFGYTKEQFYKEQKNSHSMVHPEDRNSTATAISKVKETKQSATFRYRIIKRDGSIAYVRCNASVTSIIGITGHALISILTDITESVRTEQQAIVSGQRLDAIMKNMNSAVTASLIKNDGTVEFLFFNDLYHKMFGYTEKQFRAEVHDPCRLIHPDDVDDVRGAVFSLHRVGDAKELLYRAVTRDKEIKWLRTRITMMTFPDAERPVQLAVYSDVTDIMEAQEKISSQRDQIASILNGTPSGIAIVEVDSRDVAGTMHTVFYNDRFISFSGYERDEYDAKLKNNEMAFVFEEDIPLLMKDIEKLCAGEIGVSADTTIRCHTKDGGFRWLLLTGQLTERRGDICVINVAIMDVTERQEAIDRQRISEEMLRIAAETDQRSMIVYNVKNNSCRVESRTLFSAKYGEIFENIPQSLINMGLTAPDSEEELCTLFARIREGEKQIRVSLQLHSGPEKYEWFECNATTVFDAGGIPDHAVLVFHNITEQRVKEAVFRKWQQSIDVRAPESYSLFRCNLSKDASIDEQNGSLLKVSFPSDDMSFNSRTEYYAEEYVFPDDREAYTALLKSDTLLTMFYRGEHSASLDYRETAENGEVRWRRLTVETVEYPSSTEVLAFLMYEDIDEEKRAEIVEQELAKSDPLTGALNRVAFSEKIDEIISANPNSHCALIMLDMDGFKQLNDTFGHAAGDQALQEVVAVLRSYARSGDLVCRLGGDEFLVWLRDVPYDAVIGKTAQQMCEHIRKAYSQKVLLSASAGIAVYPRDGRSYDELYPNADKALYKVKQAGKGSYAFFSEIGEEQTEEVARALSAVRPSIQSSHGAKRRMLIADDNEINRMMLRSIFGDDYLIETAKNGAEAMIRLRHFGVSIAVVLLDLRMPGVDGFEVLRRMQSDTGLRTIPVIVVTGDEDHGTLLKAFELGAAEYVAKPVDEDIIRMRVKAVISKAESERLRAQNSYLMLQRNEEVKYRTVLASTGTVVIEYDWRNHVFIYDSEVSRHIAGKFDHRGLWQVLLSDMVADSADVKTMQDMLIAIANSRGVKQNGRLIKLKTPEGVKHWFRMNIYKSEDEFGLAEKMILTFNDVHEEVLANDRLLFQATRDELTGLYNRAGFLEKATELIACKEPGHYVMACIDVESFRVINDQYGTEIGDEVLRHVAATVCSFIQGHKGLCCRYTADKFAVLYPAKLQGTDELALSHRTAEAPGCLRRRLRLRIGRCLVNDTSLSVSAIFDRAAMAEALARGRYDTHIVNYDESMRDSIMKEQRIVVNMVDALQKGEFEPWFQPQYNHATGALIGAEALVRWHKNGKIIPPDDFIPVFEKNGFIYEVDQSVWRQVCVLLRRWTDEGKNPLPVSVNISRHDMFQEDFVDVITGLVAEYQLPAELLRLEITESAFAADTKVITDIAGKLIAAGFTVEIDDFGSGYSSLNTLKDVPASILKLDMRFFETTENSDRGGNIVESIVRMAKWLGMAIIAEGVEDRAQADYLKSIGCYYIQGYYYSKPLPVDEYEKKMKEGLAEHRLSNLETLESLDADLFWDPKSMETLIFNSYVGGACIFEYHNGKAEILRYNDQYVSELNGLIPENAEIQDVNIVPYFDSRSKREFLHALHEALDRGQEASSEMQLTKGEQTEYVRQTCRVIAKTTDSAMYYCVIQNITGQRKLERERAESAKRLSVIMSNINGGISASVFHDENHVDIVFANDGFYKLFGYSEEQFEVEVSNVIDPILLEDRDRVMATVARIVSRRGSDTYEYRCRKRDGSIIWVQTVNTVVSLAEVGDTVLLAVTTDITELRRVEKQSVETADRLNAVMNAMTSGMTAVTVQQNVQLLFANDRYYQMHGVKQEGSLHDTLRNVFSMVHPDDCQRVRDIITSTKDVGQSAEAEYRVKLSDGTERWIKAVITVTTLAGVAVPAQVAIYTDITDEKKAGEQIRFLNESASEILAQPDSEKAIKDTLQKLLQYFAGERSYIFEIDDAAQTSDNTYEVCAPGVTPEIELLKGVPYDTEQYWFESFNTDGFVVIPDVVAIEESKAAMRDILLAQNIRAIIVAPLWRDGRLIGYIGVDNPTVAIDQVSQIIALSDYVAVLLTRRDLMREVKRERETVQQLMDDTPGGFVRMELFKDKDPIIVTVNDGLCKMLEMARDEVMKAYGENVFACLAEEDAVAASDEITQAYASGRSYISTCRLRRKNGGLFWVMLFGRFIHGEAGRLYLNAYFTDITEQKSVEQLQSELLENLPSGAALYEFDGENVRFIHINKNYWKLVDRTPLSAGEITAFGAFLSEDRAVVIDELKSAIRQGRNAAGIVRILCGDGGYHPFSVVMNIVRKKDGNYLLYTTFTRISEEEMAIQKMLPVALSTIVSNTDDMSYVKDKNLRYICVSQSVAEMAGAKSPRDLIGKTAGEAFTSKFAEKFDKDDRHIIETGKHVVRALEHIPSKDGSVRLARTTKFPILDVAGNAIGVYCVSHDITTQQEKESQLELLTDTIPGGLAAYSLSKERITTLYFNDGFYNYSGYTREEYIALTEKEPLALVLPEDRQGVLDMVSDFIAGKEDGMTGTCTYRCRTRNGEIRWMSLKAVLSQMGGEAYVINAVQLDITEQQEERERLRVSEELNRLAIDQSGKIISRYDVGTRTLTLPDTRPEIFNVPRLLENMPEEQVQLGRISPDTADAYCGVFTRINSGEASGEAVYQQNSTLGWRWLKSQFTTVFASDGRPLSAVITFEDITEQRDKEAVYTRWQNAMSERSEDSYTLVRCNLNRTNITDSWDGSLLRKHFTDPAQPFNSRTVEYTDRFVYADDRAVFRAFLNGDTMLAEYHRGHRSDSIDYREQNEDGSVRWLRLTVDLVEYPDSTDVEAYLLFENIDEQKHAELSTLRRAETDPLTGVLNRATFAQRANQVISSFGPQVNHALLMLDVDGFKRVNDIFGHGAGDQTLIEIANALTRFCRKDDLVGRLGGDEFFVFLSNIRSAEVAEKKARQICDMTRRTLSVDVHISTSIGIALHPQDGDSFEALYQIADEALYRTKNAGKDGYSFSSGDPVIGGGVKWRGNQSTAQNGVKQERKARRILIVDDNAIAQTMLETILKDDYYIEKAMDGSSALAMLHHYGTAISVVLLDLMMPGMNGFEVLEKIQQDERTCSIPVIVVSADENRETALRVIRAGASDLITKPVDADLLRIRVESAVSKSENERLRVQNSYLAIRNTEVSSYRAALEYIGTMIVMLDWDSNEFLYSPAVAGRLAGQYDERPLWTILRSDNVTDEQTVQQMQQFIEEIAGDNERTEGSLKVRLKSKCGLFRTFELKVFKELDNYGLTLKMIMMLKEVAPSHQNAGEKAHV